MLDILPAGQFFIVMQIELRLSQTHGPYFIASPTQGAEQSFLFDEKQLDFGCSLHRELRMVPPDMEVFTFGDQAREKVARALRDAGHSVSLAEPDPFVYVGPVAAILDLREGWDWNLPPEKWELPVPGLLAEHSVDLLRMATDQDLTRGNPLPGCLHARWHAWQALALLQIEEALEPLAEHIDAIDWSFKDDDEKAVEWALEELAPLFATFGPMAVPTLAKRLLDPERREEVRTGTVECLKRIGEHPAHDPATVCPLLHRALEAFEANPPALNAVLISALIDFEAHGSLPLVEAAFAADRVDEMWRGDWEDIQMELGMIQQRTRPRRPNKLTEIRDAMMKAMDASLSRAPQDAWDHALPAKPAKVGRNDPCPCGSGKKRKKCCG